MQQEEFSPFLKMPAVKKTLRGWKKSISMYESAKNNKMSKKAQRFLASFTAQFHISHKRSIVLIVVITKTTSLSIL
jgi:Holliday junction resolvase RusA-like endonuclease